MLVKVGIVGAGSMGTALAKHIADNGHEVIIWARRRSVVENINKIRRNLDYYPDITLPPNISATNDLQEITKVEIIFLAVPSHAIREVALKIKRIGVNTDVIIVNTAKGVEYPPFKRLSLVIEEILGPHTKLAVLSGPNFASEIIEGLPTGTTIGSKYREVLDVLRNILQNKNFIVQTTDDIIGVELGGVLKNVYAIAMGICEALGANENAYYFILNEAFREMISIAEFLGARRESLLLSSGFGDLCLTANSNKSRNRILGFIAGKRMLGETDGNSSVVFEGRKTVRAIREICEKNKLFCPLTNFVYRVIIEREDPRSAYLELWKDLSKRYSDKK